MRLRSGRRLLAPAPPPRQEVRQRRRGRPRRCTADLISGLPEDMLLEILVRLRDTRQAARTTVLSRGWRRLWTHLPKMFFDVVAGNARFRFHRFMDTSLSVSVDGGKVSAARLTSVVRIAAHIAPTELTLRLWGVDGGTVPLELPCFEATTSIVLYGSLNFTLPPAGVFASLQELDIWACICDDLCGLLARCPRLRPLKLSGSWRRAEGRPAAIRSASLEELYLEIMGADYSNAGPIDFGTPALRKFQWHGAKDIAVLRSMPMLEDVCMEMNSGPIGSGFRRKWGLISAPIGFGNKWGLQRLGIGSMAASTRKHGRSPPTPAGRVLSLGITADRADRDCPVERSFAQEIAGLPRALNVSVLKLGLRAEGHVRGVGALVLEVLTICPVHRLELVLLDDDDLVPKCSDMCDCDQVSNGTSQHICLTHLEVVQIQRFHCAQHEIDLLKLLFRSAPMLKRMTVQLGWHRTDEPLDNGERHDLHTIFQVNPTVECGVYNKRGEKILLA